MSDRLISVVRNLIAVRIEGMPTWGPTPPQLSQTRAQPRALEAYQWLISHCAEDIVDVGLGNGFEKLAHVQLDQPSSSAMLFRTFERTAVFAIRVACWM